MNRATHVQTGPGPVSHACKYALLVGDGMADRPLAQLGNKTILETAATPNMDAVARNGVVGMVATIPEGMPAGSDVGNLSLFGYDPARYFQGRAPIEAASMGVPLAAGDSAFRCNFVTIADGRMKDYSAGHLDCDETAALVSELKAVLDSPLCTLHHGVDYRHLLVMHGLDISGLAATPPHDITGQPVAPHLPAGPAASAVRSLMDRARPVLASSAVNAARRKTGRPAVTDIWLWGQGKALALPGLQERFGIDGTVISAVNLVKGLGRLAGLDVADVPGATGYLGTNYAGKVAAAVNALQRQAFVYLHVEAPDETGHEGSVDKKRQAIEEFDMHVVGPILKLGESLPGLRILVVPDHSTPVSIRTHGPEPVPFAMCGPGIAPSGATAYSEKAGAGAKVITGPELFERFMRSDNSLTV